jgi:transcriptional regulator with XRE-family HTH domain
MSEFGEYVRELREKRDLGLREFCEALRFDPSRWSKMERGILQPPTDHEILEKIGNILGIGTEGPAWDKLRDLAFLSRGEIPDDILSDKELVACLPLMFRTIRGDEKPTPAQLRKLADKIRHNKSNKD